MVRHISVDFGVRQGAVLSPHLFALYLDDLSDLHLRGCAIILYADDILLISTSVCQLQKLLHICEKELSWLDMSTSHQRAKFHQNKSVGCEDIEIF